MRKPIRTCVGCGRKAAQPELVRFVVGAGKLAVAPDRRMPGGGADTCRRQACLERALARRAFPRSLRRAVRVPEELNVGTEEG